jgi:hypothetical protein
MADVDLRPMSLGEVLDRTFNLYKNHFWLFTGITALPFFLLLLVEVGMAGAGFGGIKAAASQAPQLSPGFLASAVGGGLLVFAVYVLMIGAAHAATVFAVSDLYLARPASIRGSFARVGWKFLRVVLVFFLIGLVVGGAFLMVVVFGAAIKSPAFMLLGILVMIFPAIILFCRTSVAVPAAMLEDSGAVRSLERSMHLTKGHVMQIFVIFLLVVTMTYVAVLLFQMPVLVLMMAASVAHKSPSFALQVLQHFAAFVSQVLVGPIGGIAFSLMYYNLRVRKEAFDIQHLMASLGTNPAPSAPSVA